MEFKKSLLDSPLKLLWSIVNTVVGAIGLISVFDDLVAWKSFIPEMISIYKSITSFPFQLFNIHLDRWLIDYFFFGSLSGSAFVKAIGYGEKKNFLNNHGNPKSVRIMFFILHLFFWPLAVVIGLKQVLFGFDDPEEVKIKKMYFQWVLSILFLFLLFFIFNATV